MSENPIQGNPEEFESVERLFGEIRARTENLESVLSGIAQGTSQHFRGAAADTFSENITALAPKLGAVPDIARQVEQVVCNHKNRLVQLQQEARRAVARHQTNWDTLQQAISIHDGVENDLHSVRRQISWVVDDSERVSLEDRADRLERQERQARTRRDRADEAWERSGDQLDCLGRDEEQLNEDTAKALRDVDVGVLADPSWLEKLTGFVADIIKAVVTIGFTGVFNLLPTHVLKIIYSALEVLAIVLLIAVAVVVIVGLIVGSGGAILPVLACLSVAGIVIHTTKFGAGFELYTRGEKTLGDVLWDAVDVALAIFAGPGLTRLGIRGIPKHAAEVGINIRKEIIRATLDGGEDRIGAAGDWIECGGTVSLSSESDARFGAGDVSNAEPVSLLPPTNTICIWEVPTDVELPGIFGADGSVSSVSVEFQGTDVALEDFALDDFSFSGLADFVYDNPDAVPDLSELELYELEAGFDWHFDFSPPEVILADFDQALEELKLLVVPCELGS